MAIVYTQAMLDAAVLYATQGGPGGGPLTKDQFNSMTYKPGFLSDGTYCILTDFCLQLQCAIRQGHAGLANCGLISRDKWGAPADAFRSNPYQGGIGGIADSFVNRLGVIVSG